MNRILTTLCLISANSQILLGYKKRGFGANRWNGFGGKVRPGENIQDATIREVFEECGLKVTKLRHRAVLNFEFEDSKDEIEVHLYEALAFEGEPVETDEMRPQWFYPNEIPFDKMWPDDRFWFPYYLDGMNFEGKFLFKDQSNLLDYKITETNVEKML